MVKISPTESESRAPHGQAIAELGKDAQRLLARALAGDERARWALAHCAWSMERLDAGSPVVAQARLFLEPIGMWNERSAGERS